MAVWVVQEVSGKNVLPAQKYGKLKTLIGANSQIVLDSEPTTEIMRRKLSAYGDDDFLIAIGDPAAIGIACAVAASRNAGRFKLLKWDRQERQYYPVEVDIGA